MRGVRTVRLVALLCLLLAAVVSVSAQDAVQLTNVTFANGLTISVPSDWLTFKKEDHTTAESAQAAWQGNYDTVRPGFQLSAQAMAVTDLAAMRPQSVDDRYIQLSVAFFPISELASSLGLSSDQITLQALAAQSLGGDLWREVTINGRQALIGTNLQPPTVTAQALYLFPEEGLAARVQIPVPDSYIRENETLLYVLIMSLRRSGEPVDMDAWTQFTEAHFGRAIAFPTNIALPVAAEAFVPQQAEATEAPLPEATEAPVVTGPVTDPMLVCAEGTSELTFVANTVDGAMDIFLINADGTDVRQLTTNMGDDFAVTWAPDGSQMAFTSTRDVVSQLYVMNADGSDIVPLTADQLSHSQPAWSPDGTRIAYVTQQIGQGDIWVMDADGTNRVQLTWDEFNDGWPVWSPDGAQIAFVRGTDNQEIYVMDADGANGLQLTDSPGLDNNPQWSPDGAQIVFASEREDRSQVYIMNADGTDQRNISNNVAFEAPSSWSPDGSFIAFISNRNSANASQTDVYVMSPDGTNVRQLTNDARPEQDASWRPCPGTQPIVAPEATAEALAAPLEACVISATAGTNINLRQGPGTEFGFSGLLEGGASITADAQTPGAGGTTWLRVGPNQWLRSDVIGGYTGDCVSLPTVTP
jgi:TolB protein